MINPGTYENLGDELTEAGENLNYDIGEEYLTLNEEVIEDPDNLINAKDAFIAGVSLLVLGFIGFFDEDDEFDEDDVNNDGDDDFDFITKAYKAGLNYADFFIRQDGKNPEEGEETINNGAFLARAENVIIDDSIAPAPLIGYESHLSWYKIIKESAKQKIKNAGLQVLRSTNDIYKNVAVMVSQKEFKEGNIFTRRQMSQSLLNEFADRGITGITYKNGARYSIDTYCEMLGRTLAGRTALQSSLNRFSENGYSLGIISSHFRCCPLCEPYEGITVSLDGKDNRYPSIWDAESQGLFHPNCKHSVSAFFEGFTPDIETRLDPREKELADKYGYKQAQKITFDAQQKQRYIERKIRQWKRREKLSLSDIDKQRSSKKVRQWQLQQRNHLKDNSFLNRKYSREQIKTAH